MEILYRASPESSYKIGSTSDHSSEIFHFSFDENLDELREFFEIHKIDPVFLESPYLKMKKKLGLSSEELILTMPREARKEIFDKIVTSIDDVLSSKESTEYLKTYLKIKRFLTSLKKPSICQSRALKISKTIEHKITSDKVLDFSKSDQKTVYKTSGPSTGRLVVRSGPNILALPAESRKSLVSKFPGGKILQLDLISAEPYMALLFTGQEPPEDVYSHVSENILEGKVTRDQAKLVTISALYGQSAKNLRKSLPVGSNARDIIEKTKRYFKSDQLRSQIEKTVSGPVFRNALGRPISLDRSGRDLMISYFLQSSVAECSIISFKNFCSCMGDRVVPYYVIHDALIFDAEKELAESLIKKETVFVSAEKWRFRAKITQVSDN